MKISTCLLVVFLIFVVTTVETVAVHAATADEGGQGRLELSKLASGIAIGLAALGAGLGLGTAAAAAVGAIAERPELFGRTLIYVVLVEAVAIYGLVVALLLWMA